MAIGKRLMDPIKVVSTTCDTALDRERTPLLDYVESRDEKLPVAHQGQRLTWFTLRPLKGDLPEYCRSLGSPLAERLAFSYACVACSDPEVMGHEAWVGEGDGRRVKPQVLDELPDQLRHELGHVALRLGELTQGEAPRYGLPAGLPVTRRQPSASTAASATSSAPAHGET